MKLTNFKYDLSFYNFFHETNKEFNDWSLLDMQLEGNFNLLVGKNATGKSRFLSKISGFCDLVLDSYNEDYVESFKEMWDLSFLKANGDLLKYSLTTDMPPTYDGWDFFLNENLFLNDKQVLKREDDTALVYSMISQKNIEINPPDDALVIKARRDRKEFPFFEDIIKWVEGVNLYYFAGNRYNSKESISKLFATLKPDAVKTLISDLNFLSYGVENILVKETREGNTQIQELFIKERDVSKNISESDLSQGMMRTLGLLVFIENRLRNPKTSLIAIDDLGEGLDYERATKLGKLLVEKLENSNIQFIATSNDSFLMDVIPIKYWNILQRDGNTVRALNYHNSKERFDKFLMTGLSNFDLFSSDYLMRPKP
jgi:AAA domain, putative AbiEii toxin, Type IV TA system